jgi:integrase
MATLSKSYVEKISPQKSDVVVWDDKLSGFGVKITPRGRRVYFLYYRTLDGRQRKPTIGVHGQITCEQARKIALEWLAEKTKGGDPTVSDLCYRYIGEHSRTHKKARSIELEEFYIRKYIRPLIGSLKTITVAKADISKLHISMKATPAQANRILQTLSKMFNLAETWGLRPPYSNPVKGIQRYKEESRERFLTDREIQTLIQTLDRLEKDKSESIYVLNLIRLLMLTGARLSEIRTAKWEWVDFKNGLLNLPDSKTGKKTIYLSPAALEVLENTPQQKNNPYIILGHIEGHPLHNAQKPWRRIRQLAGLDGLRIHDLRHTFASLCIAQGFSLQMVAKLLGHADTRMSERYAHLTKTSIRDAATSVGNFIYQT